jgi:hypothetical protein
LLFRVQIPAGAPKAPHFEAFLETQTLPSIIWDSVDVALSVPKTRIDVGSSADIQKHAVYAYDGTTFSGSIHLNDTETKNAVGKYGYKVSSISDPVYGLTAFSTNEVCVIWDKVTFTLSAAKSRVSVGSVAQISATAVYAFDNSPFKGSYSLNDTLVKTSICKCGYKVSGIVDELYGLTSSDTNEISIIFDKVVMVDGGVSDEFAEVGKPVTVWFKAVYAYDGKTFDDAEGTVYVDGKSATWSERNERWEYVYTEGGLGSRATFKVTAVSDTLDNPITFEDNVGSKTVRRVLLEPLYKAPVVGSATRQLNELFPGYGSIALIAIFIAILTASTAPAVLKITRKKRANARER